MKYRFITILHNMKLESEKNLGIQILPGARISNGTKVLSDTINNELMHATAGAHSIDEFKNSVYYYVNGEFKDIKTQSEMDKVGTNYTFCFLRQIQFFLTHLWEVKDNNIYVRDGFLITFENDLKKGFTYKASISAIFSYSTLEKKESLFTDDEINVAKNRFDHYTFEELIKDHYDWKYANDNIFYKASNSERIDRASYFILSARASSIFPMKIVSYCTALECLFTSGKTEINHKIAERVAVLLGNSKDEKKELYQLIKKAYDIRSTIVHGSNIKGKSIDLLEVSKGLDDVLRTLLIRNYDVFSKKDNEIEDYFVNLILTGE